MSTQTMTNTTTQQSPSAPTTSTGQYLLSAKTFETRSEHVPAVGPNDVLIAPRATTLCGSDAHYCQHGRNGSIEIREPLCLGHESAGEVVTVGSNVNDRKVGDRVAIEPGVACGACEVCEGGRYNLCGGLRFRGSGSAWPHFQGSLQGRVVHPARWTHRLPDNVSYEEGALLEPLAVAVHACRRAGIKVGSSCTIIGAGAVGLLCAAVARHLGCTHIAIADIAESRVDFALKRGMADAGFVVPAKRAKDSTESLTFAKELARSLGDVKYADGQAVGRSEYTFECTGVETCVQASIYSTKSGGKSVLVGMGTPNHLLPSSEASAREIDIIPTWRYADCYPLAMEIMQKSKGADGRGGLGELITHRFEGLERVPEAMRTACRPVDEEGKMVVKVVVTNNGP